MMEAKTSCRERWRSQEVWPWMNDTTARQKKNGVGQRLFNTKRRLLLVNPHNESEWKKKEREPLTKEWKMMETEEHFHFGLQYFFVVVVLCVFSFFDFSLQKKKREMHKHVIVEAFLQGRKCQQTGLMVCWRYKETAETSSKCSYLLQKNGRSFYFCSWYFSPTFAFDCHLMYNLQHYYDNKKSINASQIKENGCDSVP